MSALRELILKSPDPMDAILKMGTAVAASGMFGCSTPQQGVVIVSHCMEKGFALLDWQARYHLIPDATGSKKPSMKSEAMLAAFAETGGSFEWLNDGSKGDLAELKLSKGDRVSQVVRYTFQQAEAAGLVKKDKPQSNWMARRPEMLRARCISSGLRMFDPSIVVGVYTPEEIEEIGDEPSTEPTRQNEPQPVTPPTVGEPKASRRGRPAGSGMKTKEDSPATEQSQQPASEATPQAASAAPVATAPAATPAPSQAAPIVPPPDLPATNQVDPKGIDTPQAQFDRIKAKIELKRQHWGAAADDNWAKVTGQLGIAPGQPIPESMFDDLEAWLDKSIAKWKAANEGKTLEQWANGAVGQK